MASYILHNTEENIHFHLMIKLQGTDYRVRKCRERIKRFDYTQLLFHFPFMHLKLMVHRSLKTNTWTKKIQFSLMVFHLSTKNIAESSATWSYRSILQTEQVLTVIIHATQLKRRKASIEIRKPRNSTSLRKQGLQKCS
jgi:Na+-transporting NADH:ubiquinone oxidoreductase subunit NqrF